MSSKRIKEFTSLLDSTIYEWEQKSFLGKGGFGEVYTYATADRDVAVKTFDNDHKISFIEEVSIMKLAGNSSFVLELLDASTLYDPKKEVIYSALVMPKASTDLGAFLQENSPIKLSTAKSICYQIACGVAYLQSKGVYHGDYKSTNILLSGNYISDVYNIRAYIADLGSGIVPKSKNSYFRGTYFTTWWRPIELLLGGNYTPPADIWALAIIFLEVIGNVTSDSTAFNVFRGSSDLEMIDRIFDEFGTPVESITESITLDDVVLWPGVNFMPNFRKDEYPPKEGKHILERYLSNDEYSLISKMMKLDPAKRISIDEVISDPWFDSDRDAINKLYKPIHSSIDLSMAILSCPGSKSKTIDLKLRQRRLALLNKIVDWFNISQQVKACAIQYLDQKQRGKDLFVLIALILATYIKKISSTFSNASILDIEDLQEFADSVSLDLEDVSDIEQDYGDMLLTLAKENKFDLHLSTSYDIARCYLDSYPKDVLYKVVNVLDMTYETNLSEIYDPKTIALSAIKFACETMGVRYHGEIPNLDLNSVFK